MITVANSGLEIMLAGSLSGLLAQVGKMFLHLVQRKPVNFRLLVQTGGMPSSHSSSMTGMAYSVGLVEGFTSVTFAIALGLALVVMYDAAGVRQAAGKMAGILNKITEDIYLHNPDQLPERLRELLGHTPYEVMAGASLGIVTAIVIHILLL
ncbi:MAG: divergent PAP2 family protein [Cyanobacteria bacterium]|nr:divergent PAP2 family protein [Cyanobacteriota bacterium]